jgi:hypothetical protein
MTYTRKEKRNHEMSTSASLIERTFLTLMRLYPADFQTEFRDEMLEVAMACWKEKRMSGFVEKCRAFLKEAVSLLVLAPREWMRASLKRPLSPVRAGAWCALAFAFGVLAQNFILQPIIEPLADRSFVLAQIAQISLRAMVYALIGLVTGLLLKASRIGPLMVAWVLGTITSYGVRFAISRILGDSLSIFTVSGLAIRNMPANAILGLFVGLGFRQVRIGGGKPRFPVLKSVLAIVAVTPVQLLNSTITYSRYMRMSMPLSLAFFSAISFTACFVAGGLLGVLLVVGRPNLAREGLVQ